MYNTCGLHASGSIDNFGKTPRKGRFSSTCWREKGGVPQKSGKTRQKWQIHPKKGRDKLALFLDFLTALQGLNFDVGIILRNLDES